MPSRQHCCYNKTFAKFVFVNFKSSRYNTLKIKWGWKPWTPDILIIKKGYCNSCFGIIDSESWFQPYWGPLWIASMQLSIGNLESNKNMSIFKQTKQTRFSFSNGNIASRELIIISSVNTLIQIILNNLNHENSKFIISFSHDHACYLF